MTLSNTLIHLKDDPLTSLGRAANDVLSELVLVKNGNATYRVDVHKVRELLKAAHPEQTYRADAINSVNRVFSASAFSAAAGAAIDSTEALVDYLSKKDRVAENIAALRSLANSAITKSWQIGSRSYRRRSRAETGAD